MTGDPSACLDDPEDANIKYYEVNVASATKPWESASAWRTWFYLHDVTGDGLADIVRFNAQVPGFPAGRIEVWVNVDGANFACVGTGGSCTVANVYDVVHGEPVTLSRVAFADMNADGVDDIVILAKQGIFRASFFHPTPEVPQEARGTRPGQLVRIRTNAGATTQIHYNSIQDLDVAASASGRPWQNHSPIVEAVVTHVLTTETSVADGGAPLASPYSFRRKLQYSYRDPAYDSWQRKLAGFRKVAARTGDDAAITETTHWFGPCENSAPPGRDASGASSTNLCPNGSDDEFPSTPTFRSWVGKPVRVDR